jgi:hypothetical protein
MRRLSFSDSVAVIGLVFTILFTVWGINLSKSSLELSRQTAKQEQKIEGFQSLLKSINETNFKLSEQITLLNAQLSLNLQSNKEAKSEAVIVKEADAYKLYTAVSDLLMRNSNEIFDSIGRVKYFSSVISILESQLNNPALVKNPSLSNEWERALSTSRIMRDWNYYLPEEEQRNVLNRGRKVVIETAAIVLDFYFKNYSKKRSPSSK